MSKARQYTRDTLRRLDTLSGNQCAAPHCDKPLIARDGHSIISKICHIEAASSGGARYNPNMTDNERRHFNNLILLCDECHVIIDNKKNEKDYPVVLLKDWERDHEAIHKSNNPLKLSLLSIAINAISNMDLEENNSHFLESSKSFDIQEKIEFNVLKRNKTLIDEYKIYHAKISVLYKELENQGSLKKENLLRNIKRIYLTVKGKYVEDELDSLAIVRNHADDIFEDIQEVLLEQAEEHNNSSEDIACGISLIMVDAFMRCKILEEPHHD